MDIEMVLLATIWVLAGVVVFLLLCPITGWLCEQIEAYLYESKLELNTAGVIEYRRIKTPWVCKSLKSRQWVYFGRVAVNFSGMPGYSDVWRCGDQEPSLSLSRRLSRTYRLGHSKDLN